MPEMLQATRGLTGALALNTERVRTAKQCTFELAEGRRAASSQALTVRLADSDDQRSAANMLVNRLYARRGYGSHHKLPQHESSVSFSASTEDKMIGTLTLTVDSPAGLALDQTFAEELAFFRSTPGAKLCELTKFAFDTSSSSMPYLAALFHIIFIFGTRWHNCTDLFIEVNPRHVRFYQSMLSFMPIGEVKTNSVVDAPAQLMWLKVSEIRRLINEQAGKAKPCTRSLYPYFFSPKEENGIYGRLVGAQMGSPLAGQRGGQLGRVPAAVNAED